MLYISLHASQHLITANYQRYDVSSFCEPFPIITHISCHPVNHYCIKDPLVALFPLDRGEKWPTSTWTCVVQARPVLPIQARPVQTSAGLAVDWHMGLLPAKPQMGRVIVGQ